MYNWVDIPMTPTQRLLVYYFWIAPHALQIIILVLLFSRGFYKKMPVLTAYTAYAVCGCITLLIVSKSSWRPSYFEWYSFILGIDTAFSFGVVYEIFSHVFANYASLRRVHKPLFRWTTVAFLAVALSFAVYTHRSDVDPSWFTYHVLSRSADIVLCALILALFLFSTLLSLSWNRRIYGVALGLGIACSVDLATTAIQSQLGSSWAVPLEIIDMAAYHCCVVIWLVYLLIPERTPAYTLGKIPESDLNVWNQELEHLLHQ
jgi:hypothetical protein